MDERNLKQLDRRVNYERRKLNRLKRTRKQFDWGLFLLIAMCVGLASFLIAAAVICQ